MKCPRCGFEHDTAARVCPSCGKRRGKGAAFWVLLIACILVAALLLAMVTGGLIWFFGRDTSEPAPDFPTDPQEVITTPTTSNTVRVTVPEGYTVDKIAALMEESGVCSAEEFRTAVQNGDFSDYPFVADIPLSNENGEDNGRFYRLEGYLFPDTYEFYRNCGGEAAVRRFLANFSRKAESFEDALAQSGLTLDEAVTLASIIQWEVGYPAEMDRVSRVLWNRLESPDYPRLQCDVTKKYLRELVANGFSPNEAVYDTYVCRGLPVGAINNPGLDALTAAVSPSSEEDCADCYFFVTDAKHNAVYYSKTYAQHLAVWDRIQKESAGE